MAEAKLIVSKEELTKIKKMNIYEKISNIQNEIDPVAKNLRVGTGIGSYKAVAEGDVLDAVKSIEYKYRVCSLPINREIVDNQIFTREVMKDNEVREIRTYYSKIKSTYRFVNIDNPDEFVDSIVYSEGIDTADKGSGKAMTYGDKYSLLKEYKIETGDDPDKEPSPSNESEEQLTLEKAKELTFTFGKYKGKKIYDIYKSDEQYITYLIESDTPNQLVLSCYKLFESVSLDKLKLLLQANNFKIESLLKKYNVKKIEELTDEQIKSSIESIIEYQEKNAKINENNMLEQAEDELKKEGIKNVSE